MLMDLKFLHPQKEIYEFVNFFPSCQMDFFSCSTQAYVLDFEEMIKVLV